MRYAINAESYAINAEALEAAGYSKLHPFNEALAYYQKVVRREDRVLYYLNVYLWDCTRWDKGVRPVVAVKLFRTFMGSEVVMHLEARLLPETTIERMEAFYADVHLRLDCAHDDCRIRPVTSHFEFLP